MKTQPEIDNLVERWRRSRGNLEPALQQRVQHLLVSLQNLPSPVVAFSGGVDSAVVAGLLTVARTQPAHLLTAVGPALAARQKKWADVVANFLGANHQWIDAEEILNPDYLRNDANRCFHCKSQLYLAVQRHMEAHPGSTLLNGTNADDLHDYRPGLVAARNFQVHSPLAVAGFSKTIVRQIAGILNLPVADLPASPCLASRIQYGTPVTTERLRRIEQAEEILWGLDFSDVRVRLLDGERASIEVPLAETSRFEDRKFHAALVEKLTQLGFKEISVHKQGLQSGRMNEQLVSIGARSDK